MHKNPFSRANRSLILKGSLILSPFSRIRCEQSNPFLPLWAVPIFATSSRSSTRLNLPSNGAWRSADPHPSRPAQSEQPEIRFRCRAFVP